MNDFNPTLLANRAWILPLVQVSEPWRRYFTDHKLASEAA
jgi:hypothetical protein